MRLCTVGLLQGFRHSIDGMSQSLRSMLTYHSFVELSV